jgi:hypothetical protein
MPGLLMLSGSAGLAAAAAALWLQEKRRGDRRCFAVLIAVAVTLSLFSVIAWAANYDCSDRTAGTHLGLRRNTGAALCAAVISRVADPAISRALIAAH